MSKNENVVKMIKNNLIETIKHLDSIDKTTTKWYKFKEEFWDHNLKNQLNKV